MKSDAQLKSEVLHELRCELSLNVKDITVQSHGGP